MEGTMSTGYVIRGGEQGRARSGIIARALWPDTERLLVTAGLTSGMRCLDVGCGGGDVTFGMARMVGPSGHVTGIDLDDVKVQLGRREAEREHLGNVDFRVASVDQLEDVAAFDLTYSRFLLTHLPHPAAALRRMVRATRTGGVVVVEDIDHSGIFSHPPCPALEQHVSLYNRVVRLKGADPELGSKLPALFRQVGLSGAHLSHVQPVFLDGEAKRVHQITLENIAAALVASSLATDAELETLIRALDEFVERADTIVSFPRVFQVWARRTPT